MHCPRTDIIARGISQHVTHRFLLSYVFAVFADDEGEFGFVVGGAVLGRLGDRDLGGPGTVEGGSRFDEEDWGVGNREVGFVSVIDVVEADAADQGSLRG